MPVWSYSNIITREGSIHLFTTPSSLAVMMMVQKTLKYVFFFKSDLMTYPEFLPISDKCDFKFSYLKNDLFPNWVKVTFKALLKARNWRFARINVSPVVNGFRRTLSLSLFLSLSLTRAHSSLFKHVLRDSAGFLRGGGAGRSEACSVAHRHESGNPLYLDVSDSGTRLFSRCQTPPSPSNYCLNGLFWPTVKAVVKGNSRIFSPVLHPWASLYLGVSKGFFLFFFLNWARSCN